MPSRIQLRRDTAANWASANPVLAAGEPGLEIDTALLKYGDGSTPWVDLPYSGVSPIISGNLVPSIDGVYSLGNITHRWKDLFLMGNSLYIGNIVLSEDNGQLAVNGNTVAEDNNSLSNKGLAGINWNLITTIGLYTVNRTGWSGTIGTPLDSQVFTGTLEVLVSSADTDSSITQNFYPGDQTSDAAVQFTRSNWNGVWTSWQKVLNTQQVVSGGEF